MAVIRMAPRMQGAYRTFTSEQLRVRFDHPAGWRVREIHVPGGRLAGEIQIFGPRREDLKYSVYIDVAAYKTPAADGASPSLSTVVQTELQARQQQSSYRVIEQRDARCAGAAAKQVLAGYDLVLPLESVRARPVAFQELTAYYLRNGQLFRLSYAAPGEDFERHRHAFERLVKSFKFLS